MDFFATLNHIMMTTFVLFDRLRNPVMAGSRSAEILAYVLGQYSILPREIVKMLMLAQSRASVEAWQAVVDDIGRNLAEECGRDTKGKSHYQILMEGILQDFGLDLRLIEALGATQQFIAAVYTGLNHPMCFHALGVAYALESSAVPELRIVYELVGDLSARTGYRIGESLQDFFDRHLAVWEPGHEAGLRLASAKYLKSDTDRESFRQGFVTTIEAMESWWQGMAEEAKRLE